MRFRGLLTLLAVASAQGASLDDVLARMDSAAKQFKSYSATAMSRSDPFDCVESRTASVEFMDLSAGQDPKVFHFNGPELAIYFPKAGEIQVIKERQYASIVNRMLLIGFSVSRDEMKKDYSLALNGAEKAGSVPATRIILTPKSRDVLKTITAIDLWIPDGQGYAIRQKVTRHN